MHTFGRCASPLLLLAFALKGIAQIPGLSSGEPAPPDVPQQRQAPELARALLGLSLAHWIVLLVALLGTFASRVLIGKLIDFFARQVAGDAARRRSWDACMRPRAGRPSPR